MSRQVLVLSEEKKQINIRLEAELYDFLTRYAKRNFKTLTGVLREVIVDLYNEDKDNNLSD
jgi:predicted DNA-binding protein